MSQLRTQSKHDRYLWPCFTELLQLKSAVSSLAGRQKVTYADNVGEQQSMMKGHGVEFAEVRPYQYGDDSRYIDWRVTARRNGVFTKIYHEEKDHILTTIVNQSQSMQFGTKVEYKSVTAAKIHAYLGWLQLADGGSVGFGCFDDSAFTSIKPKLGDKALIDTFRLLTDKNITKTHSETPLKTLLETLTGQLRQAAKIVLISDGHELSQTHEQQLASFAKHKPVIFIHVLDTIEYDISKPGIYTFISKNQLSTLNLNSKKAVQHYAEVQQAKHAALQLRLNRQNIRYHHFDVQQPLSQLDWIMVNQ